MTIDSEFEHHITTELLENEKKLSEKNTDNPITISEIKSVLKNLKNGKSSGPDLVSYEIIKHSSHILLKSLAKYFNLILNIC